MGEQRYQRVRLDVAYDGTGFAGWAAQADQRTVQGELERALTTVLRAERPVTTTVAGRTDAGVHASGQVCHLDLPEALWHGTTDRIGRDPGTVLGIRLSGVLPADVVVRAVTPVDASFDARFAAVGRRYRYRIGDAPHRPDPLRRRDTAWIRRRLDVAAMQAAAEYLVGEHDFRSFCKPKPGGTTIRRLHAMQVRRAESETITVDVYGDAFCHNQVRSMVGGLVDVGRGAREPEWIAVVLAAQNRHGVTVMPPHGLTLTGVEYPPPHLWAARVAVTRAVRELSGEDPTGEDAGEGLTASPMTGYAAPSRARASRPSRPDRDDDDPPTRELPVVTVEAEGDDD